MRKAKQIGGIRWNLTTVLENLEISQLTLHHCHLSSMNARETGRSAEEAARVACKLDARKCKTLGTDWLEAGRTLWLMVKKWKTLTSFTCPSAIADKEGGGSRGT